MSARLRVVRDPTLPGRRPHGLPGPLPGEEKLLWQGAPDWRGVARRVLHGRMLALYFGLLVAVCLARAAAEETAAMWLSVCALVILGSIALGLLAGFAVLISRTTVYTITDRRVVLRIGVALAASFNLPFTQIEQASVKLLPDGSGEIAMLMSGRTRIGWLQLWPHARPWRTQRVQPMMRCVPDAARVAELLSRQLRASVDRNEAFATPARDVAALAEAPLAEAPLAETGD